MKYYKESLTTKRKKAACIVHALRRNCLLKYVTEGQRKGRGGEEEEDVSSYWIT
jgi:hypothetical protein